MYITESYRIVEVLRLMIYMLFFVACDVIMNSGPEPQCVEECRQRNDWP